MKRFMVLLSLITILLGISMLPALAQNVEWGAMMYNSENGHVVLIGSDNAVYEDFTLPGLPGNDYSWRAMVSPDSTIIAYSLVNTFNGTHTIYAYSLKTKTVIASYIIPSAQGQLVFDSVELNPITQAFSPDSRSLAIGYTIETTWSLIVIDLANQSGTILMQLNSTDPVVSGTQRIGFDVPTVMKYDGATIDFLIIPAATEGSYTYPHYTYTISTNTLRQNYYLSVAGGDFFQRDGRYLFPIPDYRLPNDNANYFGFGQQVNALHIWNPNTTETYPIFNAPNHSISRPTFIQNGEKILVGANDLNGSSSHLWIIEQNAAKITDIPTLSNIYPGGIEGTGNGFLISVNTNEVTHIFPELQNLPNRSGLFYVNTRSDDNSTLTKQVWLSGENQDFKLIWARDNQADSRPTPNPWIAIGAPANASNFASLGQSGSQSTQSATSILQIGGQARIFTTDGDRVNMRSGAGLAFAVVERLANNTTVMVLEGPRTADGFTWWRVQTAGNSGWVVESADGIRVLQPIGTISPTAVPASGSAPANIFVGGFALVTTAGNNLNARQQASTTASVVVTLQTSQRIAITGGPVTADGYTWWQINTQLGPAWLAEGTPTERWIVPSP